jgi:hypothetical protein
VKRTTEADGLGRAPLEPSFPPGRGRYGDPRGHSLRTIGRTLVKSAKGGNLPVIRELLTRVTGKALDDAEASPPEVIRVPTGVPEPDNVWSR